LRARSLVRGGVTRRYAAAWTARGFETFKPRTTKGRRLSRGAAGLSRRPDRARAGLRRARAHESDLSSRASKASSCTERAGNRAFRPAEFRLPASEAQLRELSGSVSERARHEARLRRRSEAADGLDAERRTDRLAREGAKAGAPEIAISARWRGSFAHLGICSRKIWAALEVR